MKSIVRHDGIIQGSISMTVVCFLLLSLIYSCQKTEQQVGLNGSGQVKLDNIGITKDGWVIGELVVSHNGSTIYYAVLNVQTFKYELRMMDAQSNITKLFSGDGEIDALDISNDDNTLLYSTSTNYGSESSLYEYPLNTRIPYFLTSVTGDGYFWDAHYLPDGNIVYTQGDGRVSVSLRRIEHASRQVTVLLDKSENPLFVDIDRLNGRLLIKGWSNNRIITLKFDGTDLKDYGEQTYQISPVCFSSDGSEILAYQQGIATAAMGSAESFIQAISYDIQTGKKSILTHAQEDNWPLAYGKDKNELILQVGNPRKLSLFDRSSNVYNQLTENQLVNLRLLGFYGNSRHRILFEAQDQMGNDGLYILNK